MAQSLYQSYMHIVFSTKNRKPWLQNDSIRSEMYSYLAAICNKKKSPALAVNGYHDHIHLLVRMGKTMTAPVLIGEMKEDSSKWIKTKDESYADFYWQSGYGAFSVSATHVDVVQNYIESQEDHHRVVSFQEEYRRILGKNKIQFDEQYVWD